MTTVSSPNGKPAPKPAESKPEYKTWELEIPLHCEIGCQHDVKKVLRKIKGVHTVHIDKQKKVTVVGNVDLKTLKEVLKNKLGKHAELWPQEGDQKQKKQEKGKSEKVMAEVKQGVTSPAGSQPPVSGSESSAKKSGGGSGGKKKEEEELKRDSTNNAGEVKERGSQEQQAQPCLQEGSPHSWYTPVDSFPSSTWSSSPRSWYTPPVSFPSSTWLLSPSSSGSNSVNYQRPTHQPQSPSHVSPAEEAGLIALLKDKSVDELRKLLSDKDAYNQFLLSVHQVKTLKPDELCKEILQLQISNLEKEAQAMELGKLCMIIWTAELAAAQEKLNQLLKQKEDIMKFYSPA